MNDDTLLAAEKAAREFLARAEALRADSTKGYYVAGTAASGALRRSSMELTRALAALRKPS